VKKVPATGDGEPQARGALESGNALAGLPVAASLTCRVARLDDVFDEPVSPGLVNNVIFFPDR
jgi:hypothetical protein